MAETKPLCREAIQHVDPSSYPQSHVVQHKTWRRYVPLHILWRQRRTSQIQRERRLVFRFLICLAHGNVDALFRGYPPCVSHLPQGGSGMSCLRLSRRGKPSGDMDEWQGGCDQCRNVVTRTGQIHEEVRQSLEMIAMCHDQSMC
jgi:hypothetical protein